MPYPSDETVAKELDELFPPSWIPTEDIRSMKWKEYILNLRATDRAAIIELIHNLPATEVLTGDNGGSLQSTDMLISRSTLLTELKGL